MFMKKRKTRAEILTMIDYACLLSAHAPIKCARIDRLTKDGAFHLDDRDMVNGRDQTMARLMDLSLTHRLAYVESAKFFDYTNKSLNSAVTFVLKPSRDFTTNIDAEMMEHIANMRWRADDDSAER